MAITLRVNDYCQNCPYFEPKVCKTVFMGGYHETLVTCEDMDKCERLVKFSKEVKIND